MKKTITLLAVIFGLLMFSAPSFAQQRLVGTAKYYEIYVNDSLIKRLSTNSEFIFGQVDCIIEGIYYKYTSKLEALIDNDEISMLTTSVYDSEDDVDIEISITYLKSDDVEYPYVVWLQFEPNIDLFYFLKDMKYYSE